jgi:hypothetical protein
MFKGSIYSWFWSLHDLSSDDHFVKDLVNFVEVKDKVKLTHTAEVLIKYLHK